MQKHKLSELVASFPKPEVTMQLVKHFKAAVHAQEITAQMTSATFVVPQEIKRQWGAPTQKSSRDFEYVKDERFEAWWEKTLLLLGIPGAPLRRVPEGPAGAGAAAGSVLPVQEKLALSVSEVAELLSISKKVAYQLVRSGQLVSFVVPGTAVRRVSRAALLSFIERLEAETRAS